VSRESEWRLSAPIGGESFLRDYDSAYVAVACTSFRSGAASDRITTSAVNSRLPARSVVASASSGRCSAGRRKLGRIQADRTRERHFTQGYRIWLNSAPKPSCAGLTRASTR